MIGHRNRFPRWIVDQEIPQVGPGPTGRGRRHAQLLVEVTVIQPAMPVNADQGAAHHPLEIFAAVAGLQQLLVGLQLAPRLEPAGKALDRHVGQGVEAGENHPMLAGQHPAVIGFQLGLGGRQRGALGVVDEVQAGALARLAVAKGVELAQGRDAAGKYARSPLAINVGCQITGQGGHHRDALARQKMGQILLAGLRKDGEVAAIDHLDTQPASRHHQLPELGMELGRPTGEIQAGEAPGCQHLWNQPEGIPIHRFGAGGSRIHMAVAAGLVAAVAEVHLQGGEGAASEWGKRQMVRFQTTPSCPLTMTDDGSIAYPTFAMLQQPPRGYVTLARLGLVTNALAIPAGLAVILLEPTWRTANLVVGASAVLPTAVVGLVASIGLLKWRAWGQILAIVALAMALAVGLPYGIVRLALLSEGRLETALLSGLLWSASTAALVFWCRPCIRRYLI